MPESIKILGGNNSVTMDTDWIATKYDNVFVNHNGEVKKIIKGKETVVKGCKGKNGYLRLSVGKTIRFNVHALIAETLLPNPHGLRVIDHINRDKTDNRLCNLRWFSQQDNMLNIDRIGNCVYCKEKDRWLAKAGYYLIGTFKTEAEARACKYGYLRAKGIEVTPPE
jgi:hypothetical protein